MDFAPCRSEIEAAIVRQEVSRQLRAGQETPALQHLRDSTRGQQMQIWWPFLPTMDADACEAYVTNALLRAQSENYCLTRIRYPDGRDWMVVRMIEPA